MPSAALAERIEKEEEQRVADQVKKLGPEGLAKAQQELDEAKAAHDEAIPEEVLQAFPVPDVKSISWIPVQSVQEGSSSQTSPLNRHDNSQLLRHINSDGDKLPFFVQFDHADVSALSRMPQQEANVIGLVRFCDRVRLPVLGQDTKPSSEVRAQKNCRISVSLNVILDWSLST